MNMIPASYIHSETIKSTEPPKESNHDLRPERFSYADRVKAHAINNIPRAKLMCKLLKESCIVSAGYKSKRTAATPAQIFDPVVYFIINQIPTPLMTNAIIKITFQKSNE